MHCGEVGDQVLRPVAGHDRHEVAAADAQRLQPHGGLGDAVPVLEPGERLPDPVLLPRQRRPGTVHAGVPLQDRAQRLPLDLGVDRGALRGDVGCPHARPLPSVTRPPVCRLDHRGLRLVTLSEHLRAARSRNASTYRPVGRRPAYAVPSRRARSTSPTSWSSPSLPPASRCAWTIAMTRLASRASSPGARRPGDRSASRSSWAVSALSCRRQVEKLDWSTAHADAPAWRLTPARALSSQPVSLSGNTATWTGLPAMSATTGLGVCSSRSR